MYKTVKLEDALYPEIIDLTKKCFGSDVSEKDVRNLFDTTGFGLKNIGVLAQSANGDFAAYYGVFPLKLTYQGKDFLVAQSGNTMTAPEHQKKGLFTMLAKETYTLSKKEGIQLIFGFPNYNSYPGFKSKLDWVFNGKLQKVKISASLIPLCEITSKVRFLEPFYRRICQSKLKKYKLPLKEDTITSFSASPAVGSIKKDINFFQYKMRNPDIHLISFEGFTLFIKLKEHLIIGAAGFFEQSRSDDFISAVRRLAKKLFSKSVMLILSENHWLFSHLSGKLVFEESLPIGFYLINDEIEVRDIEFTQADSDTF